MTATKRIKYVAPFLLMFCFVYSAIQHLVGHSFCSFLIPIDNWIPFVPEFIWVYHTLIPVILFTTIILIKTRREFFVAYNACIMAAFVLFAFFLSLISWSFLYYSNCGHVFNILNIVNDLLLPRVSTEPSVFLISVTS